MKAEEYNSKIIDDIMSSITLYERLETVNEMFLMIFLIDNGISTDNDEVMLNICEFAKKLTEAHIDTISEWKNDGSPV